MSGRDRAIVFGVFMPQEAGESWVAVHQLAKLMEEGATCSPQALRDALAGAEFTSGPEAALPPGKVAYDEVGANQYITPILVQWQGGKLSTVFPLDVAAAPALPLTGGA